ncbi:GNAT family N-acetyltransferase [Bacillus sp. SD088]|uniref:GNAT family N-acetyltransferase n=1 Tax=Bacillus sp. SD088 TaxID=2782012 RepID=UPI001F617F84|nr:GNAT family protein [Bacillus sp. SD088]
MSKVSMNDLDFICRIECDKSLWEFEEIVQSNEDVVREEYIDKIEKGGKAGNYDFIVNLAKNGRKIPIGLAQIWSYNDYRKSWEIGFAILPEYWGRGYGGESAKLLLKYAFERLNAHKVVGMCNSNNKYSAALMEHIGMVREAIFKEELFWKNKWTDQYYYSILEKEFFRDT